MSAGKIKHPPGDFKAVRAFVDKANAAQGDRHPKDYMKSLCADTPLP
jgi:hypothetical protein